MPKTPTILAATALVVAALGATAAGKFAPADNLFGAKQLQKSSVTGSRWVTETLTLRFRRRPASGRPQGLTRGKGDAGRKAKGYLGLPGAAGAPGGDVVVTSPPVSISRDPPPRWLTARRGRSSAEASANRNLAARSTHPAQRPTAQDGSSPRCRAARRQRSSPRRIRVCLPTPQASGKRARTRVPSPAGLSTSSVPPRASTRSARPGAAPRPPDRLLRCLVDDPDVQALVVGRGEDDHRAPRLCVRERLGDDVVGSGLDRFGKPPIGSLVSDRSTHRERLEGGDEPALAENRRMRPLASSRISSSAAELVDRPRRAPPLAVDRLERGGARDRLARPR